MSGKYLAAAVLPLVLCGCSGNKLAPMEQLPPAETTVRTSSTYTGTTVDFIHVEPPHSPTLARGNSIDMPDFPEMPEFPTPDRADDPFGAEFRELFTSVTTAVTPDYNVSGEDDPNDNFRGSDRVQTAVVSEAITSVSVSRADMPEMGTTVTVDTVMPEIVTDKADAVHDPFENRGYGTVTYESETADTADFPDMRGLMPDFNTIRELY